MTYGVHQAASRRCLGQPGRPSLSVLSGAVLAATWSVGCVSGDFPLRPMLTDATAGNVGSGGIGGSSGGGGSAVDAGSGGTGGADKNDGGTCSPADLQQDNANCGACGYACVNGRTCVAGRCTPAWLPVSTAGAPSPRVAHSAATIDGHVILTGGISVSNPVTSFGETFVYDPSADGWTNGPPLNQPRSGHVSASSNGKVYVFGGLTGPDGFDTGPALEAYDPSANNWTIVSGTNQPTLRYDSTMISTSSGLFLFGGAGNGFSMTQSAALFVNNTWQDVTCTLPNCASSCVAAMAFNGGVATWGGSTSIAPAFFDLASDSWSAWTLPAGSPATPLQYVDAGDHWLVLDGGGAVCPATLIVRIFDKQAGTWTSDPAPALENLAVYSHTNTTAWTGSELFTWGAQCTGSGVGGRYQPPAP
jgi:hypothetical protein